MTRSGSTLLHYVSLDGAGGVELQFADFVDRAATVEGTRSAVVACGRRVHPLVGARLPRDTAIVREKYAAGLKLPRWPAGLRRGLQYRHVRRFAPEAVVIWNRLRDSLNTLAAVGPERCVYWERGAAWFADETPAKRAFLAGVQAILCNSRAAQRMLELRWDYRGQACVVPNALRPAIAAHGASAPRPAPVPGAVWQLGVVARLASIKGVAIAIHALAILRDHGHHARLAIAGDGPERSRLTALVTRLGLDEAVTFHGLVSDMGAFYHDIDLLVHPALREPFGQIGLEAAAHGVPAVVAAVDGLVEVVEDGTTGLCLTPSEPITTYRQLAGGASDLPPLVYDPIDDTLAEPRAVAPDALAAAVARLLTDDARYAAFSAAGLARVARDFDFDRHVNRALTAIEGFTARGRLAWEETS
ncbi:glycosyltransferase [Salinisphaera sp. Q1T1-3]|uniref:glycosyltransferase n=1 Tax=Salinisphaera sp. Q1T1-3 TaxID=2321229 RepID=UPI000E745462|nr:glycosyltransferase [Salinisphaera sp. Q1T1-3]RJS94698.1 glycosyltransferase [Salinisphaera sp. Q1T1-3]